MSKEDHKLLILDLHAPASPHLVIEFIKLISASIYKNHILPVITRPTGLAAQSGIPEAWRYAYKNSISLAILPEIRDVIEIYRPDETYIFYKSQDSINIEELAPKPTAKTILIILPSGEQSITKEELLLGAKIFTKLFTKEINPLTAIGLIHLIIEKLMK